jgi:hypothetical protein
MRAAEQRALALLDTAPAPIEFCLS